MSDDSRAGEMAPKISIILPTFNRSHFLTRAFESIRSQRFSDWELIVVDDGSTDETGELVAGLSRGWGQHVRYMRQENQGAYAARNAGLDLARGAYIAFFDSDDAWLPHHLANCLAAFEASPEVDWVYAASRVVDQATGRTIEPTSFHVRHRPLHFMRLRSRVVGPLKIIDDPDALRCALARGLGCGLQCSLIHRRVFDEDGRFHVRPRNECEDQVYAIRALATGRRFAYLDDVHVLYTIHSQNSSAAGADPARTRKVILELIAGYEALRNQVRLSPRESRELDRRLSREYFWHAGYPLWRSPAGRDEAVRFYRRALRLWPWDVFRWKTYLLAVLRLAVARRGGMTEATNSRVGTVPPH